MLHLYNSLSKSIEEFKPLLNKKVKIYVCGITPYDTTHLGHAFTYIFFDALIRYITYEGHEVIYTQNVTDINDHDNDILKRAKDLQVPWQELANYWTEKFLLNMKTLNWIFPTHYLFASKQITQMIEIIKQILESGKGYHINGSVYLDVEQTISFGKLSRFSNEQMIQVAREFDEDTENKEKRHPLDITLWKAASKNDLPHIPQFDSPWGKGRPGWHIECSTMAINSLGEQIDIHGGGIDLIFPHHESEIVQSETATGKSPFAKFWVHTGTVFIRGQKMSKSLGNLILVDSLLEKYSANTIRYVLLMHHYREQWEYKDSEFDLAEATLEKIQTFLKGSKNKDLKIANKDVLTALNNDFNVPEVFSLINKLSQQQPSTKNQQTVFATLTMLGFSGL